MFDLLDLPINEDRDTVLAHIKNTLRRFNPTFASIICFYVVNIFHFSWNVKLTTIMLQRDIVCVQTVLIGLVKNLVG